MELKFIDPRALKENPDKARRSKSNPQADALLFATIKAIGIVQPSLPPKRMAATAMSSMPGIAASTRPSPRALRRSRFLSLTALRMAAPCLARGDVGA